MSTVRSSNPVPGAPGSRRARRLLPSAVAVALVALSPLMAGCLERSTTVGDRYSGSVVVATTPDNPRGTPQFDLPESMMGQVSVTDYKQVPDRPDAPSSPGAGPENTAESPSPSESAGTDEAGADENPDEDDPATRVGTRASFSDLTAGQFAQLGDIVADAYGDTSLTMDLTAKRSGEVVRFRGDADLTELVPDRDYVQLTVTFGGPVTATNGEQVGESTVTWTPAPGEPSDFSADATYPDPATAAVSSWSWFVALLCVVVVLVIVRIAYSKRYRGPRPGRPAAAKTTSSSISGEGLAAAADPVSGPSSATPPADRKPPAGT
ncbi:LppM family (lipo)protein [Gordonia sp. NPDC127522]|uniref:LppM family (lipo)protein n=1 Tax=Gordonia sp. NPDC127522 TaxID=3345390 RepID=UPI00363357CF